MSRPDIGAVLLVDFPDFNFRVGKTAARRGIPVVYYIPPQVWAWRPGRAKTLARFTKGAVVLFPFEVEFLRASGVNAVFAGHPILDEIAPYLDAPPDPERFGIPPGKRGIGLLPGSRPGEVAAHLPILLAAARLLLQRFPDLHFALPVARPSLREAIAREVAGSGLPVALVDEARQLLFRGLEAAMAVSGTVTLELALLGTPAVIVYRTSWLSYQVARRLAKVDCVGLPNIASGEKFLPELIQDDCTPSRIAGAVGGDPVRPGASGAPAREGALAAGRGFAARAPRRRSFRCLGRRRRERGHEPVPADARVHPAVRSEAPPRDGRDGRACRPSAARPPSS